MSKTTATPKSSKHADTQKAEFQKMVDGSKEKIVGALKENVVDMYDCAIISISCVLCGLLMARID